MIFETHQPPAPHDDLIESFFHFKGFQPDHSIERVVPTGHVFILFELDGIERHTYNSESLRPSATFQRAWVSGLHHNHLSISAHKDSEMFVIQFKAFGAYPFLQQPMTELADRVVRGDGIDYRYAYRGVGESAMASPDEVAATMLRNLPTKTGNSLSDWHKILKQSSLVKHGALVKHLKTDYGVTHGFANLIVIKYRNTSTQTDESLIDAQYAGPKNELRPIYDAIVKAVSAFGKDAEFAPKKAYVSLRRNKQFGLIQPTTKARVDLGLNLSDVKATKRLERSGSFNAMVSHRVRLECVDDVDRQLIMWLKKAYEGAK